MPNWRLWKEAAEVGETRTRPHWVRAWFLVSTVAAAHWVVEARADGETGTWLFWLIVMFGSAWFATE